ncbi:MAG: DUF2156 domain-containing protein [Alphaproteobacteria bacterium]|nr:DUF2156 domain-containing protein [Alphaproteobacteria bacterium]
MKQDRVRGPRVILVDMLDYVAPTFFSTVAFLTGAVMLGAAAAPEFFQSRALSRLIAPLPVVELSHFFASVIGTLLLLVAAGLRQRLDSAWLVSVVLLGAGAVFSLLSGAHYERSVGMAVVMVLLSLSRHAFYRQSALRDMVLAPVWIGAVGLVVAGVAWLGFFSFENVQYRDDLWWRFAADAEASRFLRGLVTTGVVIVIFIAWRMLRLRRRPSSSLRTEDMNDRIASIIAEGDSVTPDANLAFLPDKRFLISESGRSFIMYGIQGRNWIAMGAPVGLASEAAELAWTFKTLADSYGGNVVFYAISERFLPIALDLGLSVQKVGETAIIPLETFSLEGGKRTRLRQARRGLEKEGCSFAVIPPEEVARRLSEMKVVSDEWLASHHGEEKQFTLGRFDEAYLSRFPAAVIRRGERIVAFANLWTSPNSRALAVDLMRYGDDAPQSVMVGLFVELILWAKANDYVTLDLGMAPLAGLDRRRMAPMMSRLGAFLFEHGERIYGFEGLRQFKEKFQPSWKPLYLAAPSKLDVAFALGGVALLTSGGIRGIFRGRQSRQTG